MNSSSRATLSRRATEMLRAFICVPSAPTRSQALVKMRRMSMEAFVNWWRGYA